MKRTGTVYIEASILFIIPQITTPKPKQRILHHENLYKY
jgi:hypothetical protein